MHVRKVACVPGSSLTVCALPPHGPHLPPAPAAATPDCEQAAKDLPNNPAIADFKKCATPTSISDDCCKTVGAGHGPYA